MNALLKLAPRHRWTTDGRDPIVRRGMHSPCCEDAYLTGQETRIRFFQDVLNDDLEARR